MCFISNNDNLTDKDPTFDQTQVKAIEQDHSGWTVSASWGWGGFTSPSLPLPGSSPTSCSGYFPPRLIWPNSFLFSAQGQHHICYRVYDQVSIWSDKNQHNFRATEISFIRPTNDSPVVAWSLDQKESIKSAFFIGYVLSEIKSCRSLITLNTHSCVWVLFTRTIMNCYSGNTHLFLLGSRWPASRDVWD